MKTGGKNVFVRELNKGMGTAVAERTVLRRKKSGEFENWGDVAHRVALGNSLLCVDKKHGEEEYTILHKHIAKASILMSGRHLQHGDENQPSRNIEVFSNCSTAAASFLLFYLLLNGSGVGRSYDDDIMLVDWDNAPNLRIVLDSSHPDFDWSAHESVRDALHKYGPDSKSVMWFKVPDSREGWATALEIWENAAFEKIHRDKTLILDFSAVRPKGSPIGGMQDRPASGPVALMNAFGKASSLKGSCLPLWKQAMYLDHYFAECVLVGGARRAARMSTKFWSDVGILDFIRIKRPIEFHNLSMDEVIVRRKASTEFGFLWSSNNSVMVDAEFWRLLDIKRNDPLYKSDKAKLARKVFKEITQCSYADGTGEPGMINVDQLVRKDQGLIDFAKTGYVGSKKYQIRDETEIFLSRLAKRVAKKQYNQIVNPCAEITLNVLGAYCVIADVVPFHADTLEEAEEAFRVTTRALIRTNTMDSLYHKETARTNRIGVGMTGVHEFAWKFFQVGFRDLVNPDFDRWDHEGRSSSDRLVSPMEYNDNGRIRAAHFWHTLARFNAAVIDEAKKYSAQLGVNVPHTMTTIKPAGCGILATPIKTTEGVKTFEEIFIENDIDIKKMNGGDWFDLSYPVTVFDMNGDEKNVTKLYCNGVAEVFEIIMEDGFSYRFTGNHQVLTKECGWKRIDHLNGDENIISLNSKPAGTRSAISETEKLSTNL
jgi:hypothetical protein